MFLKVHSLTEKDDQVLEVEKYIQPKPIYHYLLSQPNTFWHDFIFLSSLRKQKIEE